MTYTKGDRVKYRLVDAKRTGFGEVESCNKEHVYIRCSDNNLRRLEHVDVRLAKQDEK